MENYKTSDFQLAVTLSCLGHNILSVDSTSPRAVFEFDGSQNPDEIATSFYRGEIKLDPKIVLTFAKVVKARLYANGNDNNGRRSI